MIPQARHNVDFEDLLYVIQTLLFCWRERSIEYCLSDDRSRRWYESVPKREYRVHERTLYHPYKLLVTETRNNQQH